MKLENPNQIFSDHQGIKLIEWDAASVSAVCEACRQTIYSYPHETMLHDKAAQLEIFNRCTTLEILSRFLNQEIVEGKKENRELYDAVVATMKEVGKYIRPIHPGWAYSRIYKTMRENDCDALTAREIIRSRVAGQMEEAERHNKESEK